MFDNECDPDNVEYLVEAATLGMEEASHNSTTEEVVSAALTFLDRTLRAKRKLQPTHERFTTAMNIRRVLQEMIVDHGSVPS